MENKNQKRLASALRDCFERKQRNESETFVCIKDGLKKSTEDKVRKLARAAHDNGNFSPDDFRYEMIVSALDRISDGTLTEETLYEEAVDCVDIYNNDLLHWLSSHAERVEYVNEAIDEYGWNGELLNAIAIGQTREIEEIFSTVLAYLEHWAENNGGKSNEN